MRHVISRQYGSARLREWLWLLGCSMAWAAAAKGQTARFPVTSEQVVAAMQEQAWPVAGVRVTLAAPMTAAIANPQLDIQTVSMLTPHEARLRMACRLPAACVPFFAKAVWPENAAPISLPGSRAAAEPATVELGLVSPHRLRAGTPATLVLEGERIHIQLQVVCLESGSVGDKVRVASRDRKRAFVAEVVSPTLLKGSLNK